MLLTFSLPDSIMNYCTLMSYVLTYLAPKGPAENSDKDWMHVLGEVFDDVSPVHNQILSTLTLLSNSLLSGQSLPPYLPLPKPYEMTRHLLSMPADGDHKSARSARQSSTSSSASSSSSSTHSTNPEPQAADGEPSSSSPDSRQDDRRQQQHRSLEARSLLDARNMEQKGYTEFAVLQVCSTLIVGDLEGLIATVAGLVGTVDFSFRVEHTESDSSVSDLGSVRRVGTWASRAAEARAAASAGGGGEKGKGKKD